MKTIPLGNSDKTALVDDADYERVMAHNWFLHKHGYAATQTPHPELVRRQKELKMHRLIVNAGAGQEVHHRDRNPLNNTRQNLHVTDKGEHVTLHRIEQPPRRAGAKGVVYRADWARRKPDRENLWVARLEIEGKKIALGCFPTEEAAARAYDRAVKAAYGGIPGLTPYVNFPD